MSRYAPPLTPIEIAQIRKLRYQDGLSIDRVAQITERNRDTIRRHAPGNCVSGRRVPAQPIRDTVQAHVATGATSWAALARQLDMTCPPNNRGTKRRGDGSRLKRALGIMPSVGINRADVYQATLPLDLATRICELIGVDLDTLDIDTITTHAFACPDCGEPMIAPAPRCGFCIAERQLVAA